MKRLIASDLHGSAYYTQALREVEEMRRNYENCTGNL